MRKLLLSVALLMFCLSITAQLSIANPEAPASMTGKVVETMNSGSYTYVLVEQDGKTAWVAVPETKIKVGQKITFAPGMWMVDFKSKTLGRTFDKIYFSGGVVK